MAPIRAYMDNVTTLTTTAPCPRQMLAKLNDNLKWARMKPCKCRGVSISKGKLVEESFYIDGEVIPSIVEKQVKSLGRWYNSTLEGYRVYC